MTGIPGFSAVAGLLARIRSLGRGLLHRTDVEAEMTEEFRHHLALRTEHLLREGLPPKEAARRARVEFGHVETHKEEARAARGLRFFEQIRFSWLDVKLGLRMLAKYPGLTVVGGFGLAVGVAVSVGFFAVLTAYIYPTLPLEEGERIVALENRDLERNRHAPRALHDFVTWRKELRTIRDLGAFRTVHRNLIPVGGPPELVKVAEMTAAGFRVARVPPRLGRHLVETDERTGAPPVVVIGHDVWQARFGGDAEVVGRALRLDATTHTIVGIMPDGFGFPESHQYWTPLKADPDAYPRGAGPEIYIFGRLAPGVTMEQAQAELSTIGRRTAAAFPETHAQIRPMVMPYTRSLMDTQGISLWQVGMMQFTMTLLLLVVAVNVAVLFYARTATRRGEIAVRSALGASRGRVVAQLFVEALVLSSVAAGAGLLLAHVGTEHGFGILMAWEIGTPFWMDDSLQPTTVFFAVGLAVLTAVIVGVVPGLQATGRGLQSNLRELGGGTGMRLGRTWTALSVAQVAIAVVVLPAVVSSAWSDMSEWTSRPTYPAEEFVVAGLWPGAERPGDAPFGDRLAEVLRRVEREPGVVGATFRASLPGRGSRIMVEGMPAPATLPSGHRMSTVGGAPDRLALFGARVLAGRGPEPADAREAGGGVVVNRAFVEKVLGGGTAVGRRVRHVAASEATGQAEPERWLPIVGVIENLQTNWLRPDTVKPALYYAVAPHQAQEARLAVRLRGSVSDGFATRIRELTIEVDPTLRLGPVRSLADAARQERIATRLVALAVSLVLLSMFLLSAAGVYALMSFAVTQRRREIGIRAALGAEPRQVLRSVFARAAGQIGLGVVLGLAGATLLDLVSDGRILGGQGEILIPAFAVTMSLVALLAAFGPARRSLHIEPTEALRAEA